MIDPSPAEAQNEKLAAAELKRSPFFARYPAKTLLRAVDRRICISDDPPFVYFRIPKAANTNVIATLFYAQHGHLDVSLRTVNAHKTSFRNASSLSADEVDSLLQSHTTFSVVRNPYTRFLSGYLEKLAEKRGPGAGPRDKVVHWLDRDPKQPILIDEFLDYLEQGGRGKDPHWMLQSNLIPIGPERLDFIGRIESIGRDVPQILRKVFGRDIPFQTFNRNATSAGRRAPQMLTADHIARLKRIYAEDFERLGYSTVFP